MILVGTVVSVSGGVGDLVGDFLALDYLAKGSVLAVQVGGVSHHNEELAPSAVGHLGTSHRDSAGGVFQGILEAVGGEFSLDPITRAAHAGAFGVPALNHKAGNNPMEDGAVIEALSDQRDEIVDSVRGGLWEKLYFNDALIGLYRDDGILHFDNLRFHKLWFPVLYHIFWGKPSPPEEIKSLFTYDPREGKEGSGAMKLISWNVNGLRACMGKGFMDMLDQETPDVICLQETKMYREQADFQFPGYEEYWYSAEKKGYSGTAIFTRVKPLSERYGIGVPEYDREGRTITLEYETFYLVTVYTPNSQRELERLSFRMAFEDRLRAYLRELRQNKPVVVCGDLNVAHRPIDLKNDKANIGNAGYTYEERGKFSELLADGFLDSFRHLHPDQQDAYSWWSYRSNARGNNVGWRIDYFLADRRLKDRIQEAVILPQYTGSDHCPVGLVLED